MLHKPSCPTKGPHFMTFETANHMEGNKLHHLLFRVIFLNCVCFGVLLNY